MQRFATFSLAAGLVLAAAGWSAGAEADAGALIREFKGEAEAKERSAGELDAACAAIVDALAGDLGADDLGKRGSAQETLEAICLRAGRPGADAQRQALAKAVADKLPAASDAEAKVWMLRQLQHIGRAECVAAVAAVLGSQEPHVAECARRALQVNPSDEAAAALRAALDKAPDSAWRVAYINAIGGRRDAAGVPALAKFLAEKDEAVALAAAAGLGRIGGPDALRALNRAKAVAAGKLRAVVLDALLACADQLLTENKAALANAVFHDLSDTSNPDRVRMAALRGTVAAQGEKAVPILTEVLSGREPAMRAFALSLVADIPGTAATKAFVALLPKLEPAEQAAMLREFGTRRDPAAKPAVVEALKSTDAEVRGAAVLAMGDLGGAGDAMLLAQMAADAQGDDQKAIFQSLVALRGDDVNPTMVRGLPGAKPPVQVQVIRALADRQAADAAPAVVKATSSADAAVRVEAAKALGTVGNASALGTLAGVITRAKEDEERQAAEKSISTICGNTEDKEACGAPLLAALGPARGEGRASLLALMPKVGTAKALEAVRGAMKAPDIDTQDAALRALADWPTDAPTADLMAVAKGDAKAARQVIALRGYVRMVGLGARPAADRIRMYQDAMAAAQRPEEKKMVLSAMAEAPSAATLGIAVECMESADLKAEAAVAAAKIAAAIGGAYPDEAKAALKKVLDESDDDNAKKQAQEAMNVLERFEDYLVAWMVSGPYEEKDKDGPGLFDVVFPPEEGDGSKAQWKPAPPGTAEEPWRIDFGKAVGGGENKAGYLRTFIHSPKAQDAQLEIGSDDGVKVWLNGSVVHANNTTRGFTPGQDKVKVALKEGWNALLMKVTQGGGGWEACARVRAPDGGKLEGIRARPQPE